LSRSRVQHLEVGLDRLDATELFGHQEAVMLFDAPFERHL
jgi:hypothetical protein